MTCLKFVVFGVAEPKGSTRTLPAGHVMKRLKRQQPVVIHDFKEMAMATITTSDNPDVKRWQADVKKAAWSANQDRAAADRENFMSGPIGLRVDFFLPRPSGLAKSYRGPHLKKPDLDKLTRSTKDAMTGVLYTDDSQVVELVVSKAYAAVGDSPRAEIVVYPVAPEVPPLFAEADDAGAEAQS
jgi:Holliday junction resolvase RusA-like endonuclease